MADSGGRHYQKLPPGWDCKYDQTTGNCYYINYITKAMQFEDPRSRYGPLQNERCSNESIAMHSFHGPGGSPYHVYPTNNMPAIRAFQTPNSSLHHTSTSPLLASSRTQLINETSPIPTSKALLAQAPRTVSMSRRSTIQETSFSNQINTDAVVNKIQNMFPTASENHIRLLLKKYYNREAVVISALQVEKHPVTMPGPYVTPPAQRHLFHSNSAIYMTPPARRFDTGAHLRGLDYVNCSSRTASPVPQGRVGGAMSMNSSGHGIMSHIAVPPYLASPRFGEQMRSSPKPHSSPKMKLRYMKTIFPKADETLLLDVLANADNNVQKASEKLISLGYVKKDFVAPPKLNNRPQTDATDCNKNMPEDGIKIIPLRPKEYTEEEKGGIAQILKEKYPQIADRIILMALESVNYAEDRAMQILEIVKEEDERQIQKTLKQNYSISLEKQQEEFDYADKKGDLNTRHSHRDQSNVATEKLCKNFKSLMGRIPTNGPDASLAKGANEGLLLADYVTWNGANPDFCQGQRNLAMGADSSLRIESTYKAYGHNKELCKGPQANLARGSIYKQQNSNSANKSIDIKCN